jgi:hypothetical protein
VLFQILRVFHGNEANPAGDADLVPVQAEYVHFELELVFHGVATKVTDVRTAVVLVVLAVGLEVLLRPEELATIVELASEVRVEHVVHAVVRHYAELRRYRLLAQVALVRAVMVLDMLLQARAVLEYALASSAAREQGTRILAVVLAALHVAPQQVPACIYVQIKNF